MNNMLLVVTGLKKYTLRIAIFAAIALWVIGTPLPAHSQKENAKDLLGLFPKSGAPTFYDTKSEFVLQDRFLPRERNSKWHPELNEASVFHVFLKHKSVEERSWSLGIGKGGHIYSIYSSFGEAMPPQTKISQWNDETWQFHTVYAGCYDWELPPKIRPFSNGYIHQSGIYTKEEDIKPFYSPLLATHFDPHQRSYSVLSWAQIPMPSIYRSGILAYANYRDLGAGIIEVTYVAYNFENRKMNSLSPWGGVRTSVFPEHVVSNPDGTYCFFDPYSYNYPGGNIQTENTGGWAAVVENADNPYGYAIAIVFGKGLDKKGDHRAAPRYSCGDSNHGERDYTVQCNLVLIDDKPGTVQMMRMYFVIGTLAEVAKKANNLVDFADYEPLNFTEQNTPLIPLYVRSFGTNKVLSRKGSGQPVCNVYAWPVINSVPLFLIRNNATKRHFITTDPYAECEREPFENPYQPGDGSFEKYQNKIIYRGYKRKTEWVEFLGFGVPKKEADSTIQHISLSSIPVIDNCFVVGEKHEAEEILVRSIK